MASIYQLRPMRFTGEQSPYWVYMKNDIASLAVIGTCSVNVRPPYTTGKDKACIELTIRLVHDLLNTNKEQTESNRALNRLKEHMDSVKDELVEEDIDSVMATVRDMVTDTAWEKFKTSFLKYLHDDYCSDFFNDVCEPITKTIIAQLDNKLFTRYQVILGSSSKITDAVKNITEHVDTSEMLSKMCFIHFYANNNGYNTLDKFIEGSIINSFTCIHTCMPTLPNK